MRRLYVWIAAAVAVLVAPVAGCQYGIYRFVINRMPNELQVTGIEYRLEEYWGLPLFGLPGDNETGIVVYGLPENIAKQISAEGVAFFMRPEHIQSRYGNQVTHTEWKETPIVRDSKWATYPGWRSEPVAPRISITEYLEKYGFSIPVEKAILELVDEAISRPGSFYSYGRLGLVVVIPAQRKAVYAYAG